MSDVFISYSRKDSEFVRTLNEALEKSNRKTWVDWKGIAKGTKWWKEIEEGIEGADTFVFVITPDSVASTVCQDEIKHAIRYNKQILPIVYREPVNEKEPNNKNFDFEPNNSAHEAIRSHNWLFFRKEDNFSQSLTELIDALNLDIAHVKSHTHLLVRALEWDKKGRDEGFSLRSKALKDAETWLRAGLNKSPKPTNLQVEYIASSREVDDAEKEQALLILQKANEEAEEKIDKANHDVQKAEEKVKAAENRKKQAVRSGAVVFGITGVAAIATGVFTTNSFIKAKAFEDKAKQFETQFNSSKAQAQKAEKDMNKVLGDKAKIERQIKAIRKQSIVLEKNKKQAEAQRKVAEAKVKEADIQLQTATRRGEMVTQQANNAMQTAEVAKRDIAQAILAKNEAQKAVNIAKQREQELFFKLNQLQHSQNILTERNKKEQNNLVNNNIQILATAAKALWIEKPQTLDNLLLALKAGGRLQKHLKSSTGVSTEIQQPIKEVLQQAQQTVQERYSFAVVHKGSIITASYSPNGRILATSSEDTTVILWDALTGKKLHTLADHERFVNSISFSPDGKILASGSSDGKIILWNVETGDKLETQKILKPFKDKQRVISISFSPDGKTFAAASDGGDIILWEWTKRELKDLLTLPGNGYGINSISFSPDGRDLASAKNGGTITIWNWDTRTKEPKPTTLPFTFKGDAFRVAFSPNSKDKLLATADTKGNFILYDVSEKESYDLVGHTDWVWGLSFSKDGKTLATSSRDKRIKLWDVEKKEENKNRSDQYKEIKTLSDQYFGLYQTCEAKI